jgi:nucleoside-diphosphate-sugar epimerase
MLKGKKLLITGASGFIGGYISEEGINRNYEVHVGIRKTSSRAYLQNPSLTFQEINFEDEDALRALLLKEKYDYIIHNAGITKALNKETYFKVNANYTRKFIKILHEEDVIPTKFVFMSSLASHGPADFQINQVITEDPSFHPVTDYGRSKKQAEDFITAFSNFPYMILRPTAVFGPREKDFLTVYKTIQSGLEIYMGGKNQLLSFIYVHDLVKIVYLALESSYNRRAYCVSDGQVYPIETYNSVIKSVLDKKTIKFVLPLKIVETIAAISERISKARGKVSILNKDKVNELKARSWACDISALEKELNFRPDYSLEEAIRETINWNKEKNLLK